MNDPTTPNHQVVALKELEVTMRVGIADWERLRPQKLLVSVEMVSPLERFTGRSIADCIDYNRIHAAVTGKWPGRPHTDLLETLAEELVGLCFEDSRVTACRVTIAKPEVYSDCAASSVTFCRQR